MSYTRNSVEHKSNPKPRVLVIVSGGVADFVADDGVEVVIFDWDDYKAAPSLTFKPPGHFADLATQCNVPVAAVLETT